MPQISCPGVVQTDVDGYPLCRDLLDAPLAWTEENPFSLDDLETADLGGAFAAGFVIVGTAYVIGLGARTLIRAIKAL